MERLERFGLQRRGYTNCLACPWHATTIPNGIEGRMGYYALAGETSITNGTWEAARSSANVALTAQAFIDQGASRVAILDVDFHHGNGTQAIFYNCSDVMLLSLHGDPKDAFPNFLGYDDETSAGDGFNFNYPMGPGTNFKTWGSALDDAAKKINHYGPDALVISLGVDTFEHDPISFFKLTSDDFKRYGATIGRMKLPTLFIMEGGYAVDEIGLNSVNVLQGYEGL